MISTPTTRHTFHSLARAAKNIISSKYRRQSSSSSSSSRSFTSSFCGGANLPQEIIIDILAFLWESPLSVAQRIRLTRNAVLISHDFTSLFSAVYFKDPHLYTHGHMRYFFFTILTGRSAAYPHTSPVQLALTRYRCTSFNVHLLERPSCPVGGGKYGHPMMAFMLAEDTKIAALLPRIQFPNLRRFELHYHNFTHNDDFLPKFAPPVQVKTLVFTHKFTHDKEGRSQMWRRKYFDEEGGMRMDMGERRWSMILGALAGIERVEVYGSNKALAVWTTDVFLNAKKILFDDATIRELERTDLRMRIGPW